jgi:hypothetical protein
MRSIGILIRIAAPAVMTLVAGLAFTAPPVGAEAGLFGVRSNASESGLYRIEPASTETHFIGPITASKTNFAEISGIAFHPTTGALYAVGFKTPPFDHVLLTIDLATGKAAVIGRTNTEDLETPGCREISDISFRSDGTLYAYVDCNEVGTLDIVSGGFTPLGGSGVRGEGNGIAFSSADRLYHANDKTLNEIDQTTGRATPLVPLRFLASEDSCPPDAQVAAMSFDPETERLFGVVYCGNVVHRLATINTTTGDVDIDGTLGSMSAIAFYPQTAAFHPQCQINGTVQRIAVDKNGQISSHLKCEAPGVGLRATYARVTSLLRSDAEYVFARANDAMPLERVCLKERSASDSSAKYEATIPETDRRARATVLSIAIKRKDAKAEDCASGSPCSRYESEVKVDRAKIGDTSTSGGCRFETTFEIVAGSLADFDGTCPAGEGLVVLGVSASAEWHNTDMGDCSPEKLRTPIR